MNPRKPRIHTKCVANFYASANERIIELGGGSNGCGGLISVRYNAETDTMSVAVYSTTRITVITERTKP